MPQSLRLPVARYQPRTDLRKYRRNPSTAIRRFQPSANDCVRGYRLVVMWIIVVVAAVILSLAVARAVVRRRTDRQLLSMRDHLNRISRDWE
jgi:hypothetical protein